MAEAVVDSRSYLDPKTLARISGLDIRARLIVEGLMTGMHRSPYQGISVEFAQHRPYVQGDDIRYVDWKVLARSDKVYLKQYQEETNLHLICVVDASESMAFGTVGEGSGLRAQGSVKTGEKGDGSHSSSLRPGPRGEKGDGSHSSLSPGRRTLTLWTKYDHATAVAASLAYMAIQQQDSVGLAIFDQSLRHYFKPSSTPGQWKTVVHELQQVPRLAKTSTGKILDQLAEKLTHRSLIVILSDFFDDLGALQTGLRHLRYKKHELIVFQILDPAELEFPFQDVTLFKGLEQAGQLLTEPRALREGYLEQLRLHTEALKKACRGLNIDFVTLNTSQGLDIALSNFLATRSASIK